MSCEFHFLVLGVPWKHSGEEAGGVRTGEKTCTMMGGKEKRVVLRRGENVPEADIHLKITLS